MRQKDSSGASGAATSASDNTPKDAQFVALLLKSMGIESCEPGVIPQLMELIYRYSTDVMADAQIYCEHAERNSIEVDDVRLAIQNRVNFSFTAPPSRETLMDMAAKKNAQPLPLIPESFGIRLPQERHCLLGLNYQVLPSTSKASRIQQQKSIKTSIVASTPTTPFASVASPHHHYQQQQQQQQHQQQQQKKFIFDVTSSSAQRNVNPAKRPADSNNNDNNYDDDYDNMDLDQQ